MAPNPFLGVLLHSIGGVAAASFYIPYKKVKGWDWETYWLAGGFFSWIVAPWVLAMIILPDTPQILMAAPRKTLLLTWAFGALWGIGGLTFGMTMRYLGIALGYAIALGLCALFGTVVPPLVRGELMDVASSPAGPTLFIGFAVCLFGIALSGKAGISKENELSDEQKKESVKEFNFVKGIIVAIVAGVLSAGMSYAHQWGAPIGELAVKHGANSLWESLPVWIVALFGGFVTNFIWCVAQSIRKGTLKQYIGEKGTDGIKPPLANNYIFCALGGVTWYLQFFFYGMGSSLMGDYDFSSWTLHMASIIIFSTLWGIILKEWKGTGRATRTWVTLGLVALVMSMLIIGYANTLGTSAEVEDGVDVVAPAVTDVEGTLNEGIENNEQ